MTHSPCDCQQFHDPATDCTATYTDLTPAELAVVDLLNLHPGHGRTVRLTPAQRGTVTRIVAWALTTRPVPHPRPAVDDQQRRRTDLAAS